MGFTYLVTNWTNLVLVIVCLIACIDTEMPLSYYSLPFCKPLEGVKDSAENLGEPLMSGVIEDYPIKFKLHANETEISFV